MGGYSETVFARSRLPRRAIVCAGVCTVTRKEAFRRNFDGWTKVKGSWLRYSFARWKGKEFVVVFGIYGAAMMLETIQCLRDGGVRSCYMVGSMGARNLPVGTIVLPTSIEDQAGVVCIDDHSAASTPDDAMLRLTVDRLKSMHLAYAAGRTVSVPAVLHGIQQVNDYIRRDTRLIGHEMEGSTFLHFARKHGIRAGALFWVSDNDRHSIIAGARGLQEARREATLSIAKVAVDVMRCF